MLTFRRIHARYIKSTQCHMSAELNSPNYLYSHKQSHSICISRARLTQNAQIEMQLGHFWVCKTLQLPNTVKGSIHSFLPGLFYIIPCHKRAKSSVWYMLGAPTRGWSNLNFCYFLSRDSYCIYILMFCNLDYVAFKNVFCRETIPQIWMGNLVFFIDECFKHKDGLSCSHFFLENLRFSSCTTL